MNNVNFTNLGGMPLAQDVLDFMQVAASGPLGALATMAGPLVIISGVTVSGSTNSNGWVAINGELLPFEGGSITGTVDIVETITQRTFFDGNDKDVYVERKAANVVSGAYNWADFVRLPRLRDVAPAGIVQPFAGSTTPEGWLLCDGSAVSRTAYAALFSAVGTTYGAGNGSTTFNLPNLKGKVPVGLDAAQAEFDTLGETAGAKAHELTDGEINHRHIDISGTGTTNDYAMGSDFESTGGGGSGLYRSKVVTPYLNGGSGRDSISLLQPYITMPYIIKY
jgi:microcystin-dependent protein